MMLPYWLTGVRVRCDDVREVILGHVGARSVVIVDQHALRDRATARGDSCHAEHHVERLARHEPETMHRLAARPPGRHARGLGPPWPRSHALLPPHRPA